ncbi:MAG: (2Fe-2S)-binding protein [Bacillota bacterium]
MKKHIQLLVNGALWEGEVKAGQTLLDLLREEIGLTGAKKGCDSGECGACVVLLNGQPVNACLVLAVDADGEAVTTIEGLRNDERARAIQEAFVQAGAVQCGFCAPGLIMATWALLAQCPHPTEQEIKEALIGHLCRCTGYVRIPEAVRQAAARLSGRKEVTGVGERIDRPESSAD